MTSTEYYTQCPECQSGLIQDYSKGEYVCQRCGYVVMEQIDDYGPESHATDFDERMKTTRASGSTSYSLHDYGLRTEIGFTSKDYSGRSIDHQMAEQMNNMRRWHSRIRVASTKERRLSNVLSKINETCSVMSLPKTLVETAAMLYRNYENKSEAKGKSIACIAAATIYLACKRFSVIRSLEEIVKSAGITKQHASSIYLAAVLLGFNLLQMDISSLAGITEVTIRNRCKDILTNFKFVVNVKPSMMTSERG